MTRKLAALAVLPIAAGGLVWPSAAAAAGAETCLGQPATIVGTPGGTITGTDGPDVVVTNGALRASTGSGDDLVCVTGGDRKWDVEIDAGDGDDAVDTRAGSVGTAGVDLGAGADSFRGGREPDFVRSGNAAGSGDGMGADVVRTGGGSDIVEAGGTFAQPDADDLDLGSGRDTAWLWGPMDGSLPIEGGPGTDELSLEGNVLRHALVIDNGGGEATEAGVPVLTWVGLEAFELSALGPREAPTFVGGDGPERVRAFVPIAAADLGGGGDALNLEQANGLVDGAAYDGGPGQDSFAFYAGAGDQADREELDLPQARLFARLGDRSATAEVRGFERHRLSASRLEIRGTAGPDHLEWSGCHGEVDGRGAADVLRAVDVPDAGCASADLVTRGGPGNDFLRGGLFPDILLGGAGDDTADGRWNVDRCVAETSVRCER